MEEKTYKRIPFDIELAKKIQAGEIEGRIVMDNGSAVCLITTELKNPEIPVVFTYFSGELEYAETCSKTGYSYHRGRTCIFIELPEETPKYDDVEEVPTGDGSIVFLRHKKHEFKPFDKVLVRHPDKEELCVPKEKWIPGIFQYKSINSSLYFVSGKAYKDCIPYEGNGYLVGTTDKPKED